MSDDAQAVDVDPLVPTDSAAIHAFARYLHRNYEDLAADVGWETQDGTSVAFENLPDANKRVMIGLASRVLVDFDVVPADDEAIFEVE